MSGWVVMKLKRWGKVNWIYIILIKYFLNRVRHSTMSSTAPFKTRETCPSLSLATTHPTLPITTQCWSSVPGTPGTSHLSMVSIFHWFFTRGLLVFFWLFQSWLKSKPLHFLPLDRPSSTGARLNWDIRYSILAVTLFPYIFFQLILLQADIRLNDLFAFVAYQAAVSRLAPLDSSVIHHLSNSPRSKMSYETTAYLQVGSTFLTQLNKQ